MNARKPNYDKEPTIPVAGYAGHAWRGWAAIGRRIRQEVARRGGNRTVVVVDLYPGAAEAEIRSGLGQGLEPVLTLLAAEAMLPEAGITAMLQANLTDDRVFGVMSTRAITDFFDHERMADMRTRIEACPTGIILVIGTGAELFVTPDILVYADMARWEIQQRYRRKELGNWGCTNAEADFHLKYKQAFFVDWRVIDRHKTALFERIDFLLDTNRRNDPRMASGESFRAGLRQTARRPFRVVPYFDPGPWGGQWMKEVCDLDRSVENFAWCFDCVPEENSLYLEIDGLRLEIPAIDLVLYQPIDLLGEQVVERFGAEFPIRFDFLDTMAGGNLSLQVHPLTEYIQRTFGMHYTQDESYYLLDAGPDAVVYLGLREDVDPARMMRDLEAAQAGGQPFPAEDHINRWPARKHDHFLIPAGTVHCSGRNAMVLEISATPYLFTFKLWDWGRLGLDGRPRPIHLEHGQEVIQWDRRTKWVQANLINRIEPGDRGVGWSEEKTGLHELEFIETHRHWFSGPVLHRTGGTVNVLNLVEGDEIIVESPQQAFAPFCVHYAETFIIPAAVSEYVIRPGEGSQGRTLGTIKAWVRG